MRRVKEVSLFSGDTVRLYMNGVVVAEDVSAETFATAREVLVLLRRTLHYVPKAMPLCREIEAAISNAKGKDR